MKPRILITRSNPEQTAARIHALGGEPILAPVLSVRDIPADTDLTNAQALLFTSANGVRAFAAQTEARDIAALCVGDATAQTARDSGFGDVRSADGDSAALADFAARTLDLRAGAVLHVSGADIAVDLSALLAARGFSTERRVLYEAIAAETLPADVAERLRADPPAIDLVLLHSQRAAKIFRALADQTAPGATARLAAACLSQSVADVAMASPWRRMIVASAPREDALLAAAFAEANPQA